MRSSLVRPLDEDDVSESSAESFAPGDVQSVDVRNAVGRVTVRGTATDAVEVHVVKRSTTGQRGLDDVEVSTTLAEGVDGYLSLTSAMGAIEASDVTGLDSVYTETGSIEVDLRAIRRLS